MKISIFGAHYTGKTTLAKKLSKELDLVYHQSDQSLEIAKDMNIMSLDNLEKLEERIKLKFQLKMLESLKKDVSNSVSDGNPISCIPYSKKLFGNQFIDSTNGKFIVNNAKKYSTNYDYIFYLPTEFEFKDDFFRHTGNEFQMKIAQELIENMSNYKVLTGNLSDRIQTAKYIINLANKPARHNHIVFEGICNSGKSTIMQMIMEYLKKENIHVIHAERKNSPYNLTTENDLILWYSNLQKHKEQLLKSYIDLFTYTNNFHKIDEQINSGNIVFSDRHKFSVIALGLGLGYSLNYMYKITSHLKTAGTILFFDLPYEESVRRATLNNKSMPSIRQNEHIQKMMSDGFKKLATIHSEVKIIDATKNKEELFKNVLSVLSDNVLK